MNTEDTVVHVGSHAYHLSPFADGAVEVSGGSLRGLVVASYEAERVADHAELVQLALDIEDRVRLVWDACVVLGRGHALVAETHVAGGVVMVDGTSAWLCLQADDGSLVPSHDEERVGGVYHIEHDLSAFGAAMAFVRSVGPLDARRAIVAAQG